MVSTMITISTISMEMMAAMLNVGMPRPKGVGKPTIEVPASFGAGARPNGIAMIQPRARPIRMAMRAIRLIMLAARMITRVMTARMMAFGLA